MIENDMNLIEPIEASRMLGFSYDKVKTPLRYTLIKMFGDGEKYIYKDKLLEFMNEYVSIQQLEDEVLPFYSSDTSYDITFRKKYKKIFKILDIENIITIARKMDSMYISKKDYIRAVEYYKFLANHPENKLIVKEEMARLLGLPNDHRQIKQMLIEYDVPVFLKRSSQRFYHLDEVDKLLLKQTKEIENWKENYVAIDDITEKLNYAKSTVTSWFNRNNVELKIPTFLMRIKTDDVDYGGNSRYVLKSDAEKYYRFLDIRTKVEETMSYYNADLMPLDLYKELLNVYGYKFNEFATKTEYYWNVYVKEKILNTVEKNFQSFIHSLVLQTGFLANVVNASNKELFKFSYKEINFALLSDEVPISYRMHFHSFMKRIHRGLESEGINSPFDFNLLRSPKKEIKIKQIENATNKEIYDPQVYVDLFNYCSNVDDNLTTAIQDAKNCLTDEYHCFANMWLYTILHLTNVWRHGDIVDFPRLEMEKYSDKNLEWLSLNPLSKQDAQVITAYYESKIYIHNKNQTDRYLIISEDLSEAFANAVLICEFVQRIKNPLNKRVLSFTGTPLDSVHNNFFKSFKHDDFKLQNLKMNQTVMTLATGVVSKMTGRNPLEIVKYLRNHSSVEISNIYVNLPNEHIEFIVKQIFDLGSFGFIYDSFAAILLDNTSEEVDSHQNAVFIKETFKSPMLVESIAKGLNSLKKEQDFVLKVLKDTDENELQEKLSMINFGLMPAKKAGFQCLLGGHQFCPKKTADCDSCVFNIPNRFALVSLGYDIEKAIEDVADRFEKTTYEAEKVRLANRLYTQLAFLRTAINKFGREVVNELIPGGLDGINDRLRQLPQTKDNVSSKLIENLVREGVVKA